MNIRFMFTSHTVELLSVVLLDPNFFQVRMMDDLQSCRNVHSTDQRIDTILSLIPADGSFDFVLWFLL